MGFRQWVREHFVTADAVYGLILYSALIAGVSDENETALEVLLISVASLLIFWAAHVFAGTVAGHNADNSLGMSLRHAFAHSSGMLYAAILPSLALILGIAHLISTDNSVDLALLIATVVLGVLGYYAFSQRRRHVVIRILGGIGTAFFGLLMIVLNLIVH